MNNFVLMIKINNEDSSELDKSSILLRQPTETNKKNKLPISYRSGKSMHYPESPKVTSNYLNNLHEMYFLLML